jgi:hypothetical protein
VRVATAVCFVVGQDRKVRITPLRFLRRAPGLLGMLRTYVYVCVCMYVYVGVCMCMCVSVRVCVGGEGGLCTCICMCGGEGRSIRFAGMLLTPLVE